MNMIDFFHGSKNKEQRENLRQYFDNHNLNAHCLFSLADKAVVNPHKRVSSFVPPSPNASKHHVSIKIHLEFLEFSRVARTFSQNQEIFVSVPNSEHYPK